MSAHRKANKELVSLLWFLWLMLSKSLKLCTVTRVATIYVFIGGG